ncbi:glycine betaine/L-proline ABC transporter ATP-binding protein [Mariniluteicoccus endophyticus]
MAKPSDDGSTPTAGASDELPAIRAEHLYKVFGKESHAAKHIAEGTFDPGGGDGTAAVIDATFDVRRGETFVVMGLSGSGKSTLIRMLNGLNRPTSGSVHVNGTNITEASAEELRRVRRDDISMVFQHFALLPNRTVESNVAYPLEIRGVDKDERTSRARRWLERVGLSQVGQKHPHELSGGMQQRVGLARALAAETDILLMDEAFSALDPLIRADLQEQLLGLQEELGKTIVFITHDLNEAMRLGDRIAIMRQGRVVQIGTADQILNAPADNYVARFTADVDRSRVLTANMVADTTAPVFAPDTPAAEAVAELDRRGHTAGTVVSGRTVLGAVIRSTLEQTAGTVAAAVAQENPAVHRFTPLSRLFAQSARQAEPLVVLDRNGALVGLLSRDRLLDAVAGNDHPAPRADAGQGPASEAVADDDKEAAQ